MAFSCKGICVRYKSQGIENGRKYQNGQKRCSHCGLFLNWQETRCPCCRTIMRTRPRSKS
ncbi:hypothetical protein DSQ19_05680 [Candidatus Nitrosotenuis sp. DW1]|nr:hypothetical protein DSQ19_05680 [Candidatus Nitrosotenuis sp. DW1]